MKRKKFNSKTFKKKLDSLWSSVVRLRDKKCLYCGTAESLHAHHAIVTRGRSLATRWDTRNGVALCYSCHMFKLHMEGGKIFLDKYLPLVNQKIPLEVQEELKEKSNEIFKISKYALEEVEENLKKELTTL